MNTLATTSFILLIFYTVTVMFLPAMLIYFTSQLTVKKSLEMDFYLNPYRDEEEVGGAYIQEGGLYRLLAQQRK